MKMKLIILVAAVLISCGTASQPLVQQALAVSTEQNAEVRDAKPNEIPFVYDARIFAEVKVKKIPQLIDELGNAGFPDEAPSYSCFYLRDKKEFPAYEKGPRYFQPAYSKLCIIPLEDKSVTNFATAYPHIKEAEVKLRELLKARPPKFISGRDINDLPFNNANGSFHSKVEYLNFRNGAGVLFLTQYTQEIWPNPVNNEELTCNFQGLTNDGKYYVAARLSLTHPSLPKGIDFTGHIERDDKLQYLRKQEQMLNGFAEASFQPSMKTLKALLSSISIKE